MAKDRSQLLLEVTNAVVSCLKLDELLGVVSSCLRKEIPHDFAAMILYDSEKNELRGHAMDAAVGSGFAEPGILIPWDGTTTGKIVTAQKAVVVRKLDIEEYPAEIMRIFYAQGIRSGVGAPMISHGRILGTLEIISLKEESFDDDDAELLTQIATQVAIAVENVSNFEAARSAQMEAARERDRSKLLLEINNAVVLHLNFHDLLKSISTSLQNILPHDASFLTFYDPAINKLRVQALDNRMVENRTSFDEGLALSIEDTPAGLAFTSRKPLVMTRADFSKFSSPAMKMAMKNEIQSGCIAPLISHGRALGTLSLLSKTDHSFNDQDAELLTQCASQIAIAVENALSYREIEALKNKLAQEKLYLEDEIRIEGNFDEIIGNSPSLLRILKQVETVAPTDSTVLIRGETGTGKELIARAIHTLSARRERTLVKLNCAAIPTGLLESELFGHEKGAFTGAISQRLGRFELAHNGSLFLDEVGDIPLELQPKLLRVLQEQEFERLGSTRTQRVNVRLVAATNCDLEVMVANKQFRNDLYYRLNVFPIVIPPLRERPQDIPLLVRFFAQKFARKLKKQVESVAPEVLQDLSRYSWPGNIRELENFIERAVILTHGPELEVPIHSLNIPAKSESTRELTLEEAERKHILRALNDSKWVIGGPTGAAAKLGTKRTSLQAKMKKLGIVRTSQA